MVLIWTGSIDVVFLKVARAKLIGEGQEGLGQNEEKPRHSCVVWGKKKKKKKRSSSAARRDREEVHVS